MRVDGWYPGESAVKIERKAAKFRQQMSAAAEEKKRKQESAKINYQVNKILQQETTANSVPGTGFSGGQRGGFYTKNSSGGNSGGARSFLDDYMDTQRRSADAIVGGLGRYLGNQLDAIGTQYQRWQPMRSTMNAEMSSWKQDQYESERRCYYSMLEENLEKPGTYTQAALENQQRIVEEAAEQANIFGLVDEIQIRAGNAARDLSMETWLKSQNRVEQAAAGKPEILQKLLHAQAGFSEMVPSLLAYEYFGALPGALLHSGSRYGTTTMLARAKQQPLETQHRAGSVAASGGLLAGALAGAVQYGLGKLPPIVSSQAAPLIQAASDGLPAAAYALGETGMSELGRTKVDPEYQFDWKNVGRSALTAWALGAGGSLYDRFASGGYQTPAGAAGFGRDQPSVGGGAGSLPRLPPGGGGTASPGALPAVGPDMAAANAGNSGMTVQKRADIVNFMQGLQKSGMPAGEAIQLAIDLAEIKQGTWKKNQSLAEQKSDTLTEEEFDAAFEKGYNEYDDWEEWQEYQQKLGRNAPQTFKDFQTLKHSKEWTDFQYYAKSIEKGELTPLADFALYQNTAAQINRMLVGVVTKNGIQIKGKSDHSIVRTIGSLSERRSGVDVSDVLDALLHPVRIDPVRSKINGKSQRFFGKNAIVCVNPETGVIIQVNPN